MNGAERRCNGDEIRYPAFGNGNQQHKNVIHGEIEMPQNKKGSILGIYGANGSGKTVIVDCMVLLKYLLSGRQIPSNFYYYINEASDTSIVKYRFELKIEEKCYLVEYV